MKYVMVFKNAVDDSFNIGMQLTRFLKILIY